jgi:hypothetical protein
MKLLIIVFVFMVLIVPQSNSKAQIFRPFPEGLGVEVGGGQNNLLWSGTPAILMAGTQNFDRTHFYLTPNIRINYNIQFAEKYSSLFFVGYNRFGGATEIYNGFQDKYLYDVVEGGTFFLFSTANFRFGAGLKANYITYVQFYTITPHGSFRENRTELFTNWSEDFGIRTMYLFSHFSMNLEVWLGLSDLRNYQMLPSGGSVKENHFRFLVGYTL